MSEDNYWESSSARAFFFFLIFNIYNGHSYQKWNKNLLHADMVRAKLQVEVNNDDTWKAFTN